MFDLNKLKEQIEKHKRRIEKAQEILDNLPQELSKMEGVDARIDFFGDVDLILPLNDRIFKEVIKLIVPTFKFEQKFAHSTSGEMYFIYKLRNNPLDTSLYIRLAAKQHEQYNTCKLVQTGIKEKKVQTPVFEMVCEDGKSRTIENL